jgi:Acyltransferase
VKLPPRVVRRLILVPITLALTLAFLLISPLLLVAAAIADLFVSRGRWQTTRVVAFVVVYFVFELLGFFALLGLWLAGGFGLRISSPRMVDAHYGVMKWWLRGMNGAAIRLFRLKILIEDRPEPRPGPILVFCRHAGPGNSLLLIGSLMIGYQRRPRIVMLAKLQWEPLFDVMLNRLPNRFIEHDPSNRQRYIDAIAGLATELGDDDALVLFPEGRDFTPRLRLRAIAHLRRRGHHEQAEKAEDMSRMLPPKRGGVMAAIGASPDADVVFVAHTVLEDVGSFKELWRRIPLDKPILSRYWRIPPTEIPKDPDELGRWLFDWWGRIDDWIEERRVDSGGHLPQEAKPLAPDPTRP